MNDLKPMFHTENKLESAQALVQTESARAVAEVQAAYVIAKKFPRDENQAYMAIMNACKRPTLAEHSMYAYPKGGTMVTGASIRLAEALCQSWGNVDCGIRELSQDHGVSVAEAYAIDLQTNTRITKVFHVKHSRDTKRGKVTLTDQREIYEMVANQGARRLRACILGVLPGDIVEAAVEQCKKTLESSDVPIKEQIRNMVKAFDEFGVKVEHIEKRLGHKLDATIPSEIVGLKAVYKSIKDGMADRSQFFDFQAAIAEDAKDELKSIINKAKDKHADTDDRPTLVE